MKWMAIMGLVLLAGCGADGDPFTPHAHGTISVGTGGTHVGGGMSMSNGTVTFGVSG